MHILFFYQSNSTKLMTYEMTSNLIRIVRIGTGDDSNKYATGRRGRLSVNNGWSNEVDLFLPTE